MAKHKRVRKAFTGIFCGLCVLICTLLCGAIVLLSLAVVKTDGGNSLGLFGYSIYLNQQNTPSPAYLPGAAIFIHEEPHETFEPGDLILCKDLDTENRFYPIIYRFYEFDPDQPLSLTMEALDDGEIFPVNRDDVLGKCVGSSRFLGSVLELIHDEERGISVFAIVLGGLGVLFAVTLCGYLLLRRKERKKDAAFLPEEAIDLFGMVEEEVDVTLTVEPLPEPTKEAAETDAETPEQPQAEEKNETN